MTFPGDLENPLTGQTVQWPVGIHYSHGFNFLHTPVNLLIIKPYWCQGFSPISSCIATVCEPPYTPPSSCPASKPPLESRCLLWVSNNTHTCRHFALHIRHTDVLFYSQWFSILNFRSKDRPQCYDYGYRRGPSSSRFNWSSRDCQDSSRSCKKSSSHETCFN